jgi:hypothetical protein
MEDELTSRHVVINATITHYEEHLAPEWSEHEPYVKMFLDRDCERTPVHVDLDASSSKGVYQVRVSGLPKRRPVHNMFAMGIKGYVHTQTKLGVPVSSDAGQDYVLIKEVLDAHKERRDYVKEIELRMPSVDNLLKGRFTVTIPLRGGLEMNGATIDTPKTLASQFIGAGADVKNAARPMMEYIVQTMQVRAKLMGERSATHARVRIPAYLGGPGMELTRGAPLPAAGFMLYEIPKTNHAFWGNAFRAVMRRDGHVLSDWSHLPIGERAQVMKEMVCYLPQYLPYKGDSVDKNTRFAKYLKRLNIGIEDFEGALEKGAGDCEDLSEAIMMCRDALAGIQFDEHAHEGLREMQDLARNYKAGMVLSTVTSAAVGGADDTNTHIGAHMAVIMTPNAEMRKQIGRADPKLARRLPFDRRYMRDDLPVLQAEGTGIYFSRKNSAIGQGARSDLYKEPCFAAMKAPIFHEFGTRSPFYREAMTMLVPDFARHDSNYIGFWYRSGLDNMRGVKYEDLENKAVHAQLVAHPEIPADVMDQMREDVKIRVPPEPLVLTERAAHESLRHPEAERICETVASWRRSPKNDVIPAAIYTRHDLLTSEDADAVIRTLNRKQGVYKVEYATEALMDSESPGIRFLIYDDVPVSRPMYLFNETEGN